MAEILASLDDINAHLPGRDTGGTTSGYPVVVEATEENTYILQVSIARVVRANLSSVVDSATLMDWSSPDDTPDPVRQIAGMLIASDLYFNNASRTNLTIEERNFAQLKYDRAMEMIQKILDGIIVLGPEVPTETAAMSEDDFWPVDDTDRAFTMSMDL